MNNSIILTDDGSNTIFNNDINESYHSKHGAINESQHIFINYGLEYIYKKEIKIFGWDLTSHSINGIEQGYVISVVQQSPYNMGTYAVNVLKDTFNGKSVPRVIDVPITLVTKSNVSQFK